MRTIGIEIEYADARALEVSRALPPKWAWSTDSSVRNSDGTISSSHAGAAGPTGKTVVAWFNIGGEVKTHPYLFENEVRESVYAMCAALKANGATVNESCALQVHVGLGAPPSREHVLRGAHYVRRHGPQLHKFFGTPEYRWNGLSKLMDDKTWLFLRYCDFEPGAINGCWKTGKAPHPKAEFVHWWSLRRVLINLSAVWRLGTYEFRGWASTIEPEEVLRAVAQALVVFEDLQDPVGTVEALDLDTMNERVEACLRSL